MIPCRHMLCFALFLFLMILVTVIDFTQGVGIYFIPSPTLCRRRQYEVADIQILRFASVDTAMIHFYIRSCLLILFRSSSLGPTHTMVDTPFQSSEAFLILISVAWSICFFFPGLSRSAFLTALSICDAYSLLLFHCCVVFTGGHIHGLWFFSIQIVTRGRGYKSTYSMHSLGTKYDNLLIHQTSLSTFF
jgi:hypothetical protein